MSRKNIAGGRKNNPTMKMVSPGAGSSSILSKLFKQIIYSIGIASPNILDKNDDSFIVSNRWSQLMDDYLSDSRNSIPQNIRERSSARGNLQKELLNNKGMSWRVFCKALRFLGVVRFELTITTKFENSPHDYVFKESINLGHKVPYPKELPTGGSMQLLNLINRPADFKFHEQSKNENTNNGSPTDSI